MTQDDVVKYYEDVAREYDKRASDYYLMYSIQPNTFTAQEYMHCAEKAKENETLAKWMRKMKIIQKD